MFSVASKKIASGLFFSGLFLIGIGVLIYFFRDIFAAIFLVLFVIAGAGCLFKAAKVYFHILKMGRDFQKTPKPQRRENVRIHNPNEHQ